jgi:hypothetical protein
MSNFTPAQLALPHLHSPFTTEEGATKWSAIMQQKTIEEPQAAVEKGWSTLSWNLENGFVIPNIGQVRSPHRKQSQER